MKRVSFLYGLNSSAPTGGCILQNNICQLLNSKAIKVQKYITDNADTCSKFLKYLDEDQDESCHTIILDGIALVRFRKSLERLTRSFKGEILALIHCPFSHPEYCNEIWLRDVLDDPTNLFEEEKRLFQMFDRIISIGPLTQLLLTSQYGVEEQRIATLSPFFSQENGDFFHQIHSINAKKQLVIKFITVGSICSRKQQNQIVTAVHRLSLRYPSKVHLTLIGDLSCDSSYYQNLLNISDNLEVCYTGSLDWQDTLRMVKNSNCFLFASRYENFGLAPVEAAMCGIPIISVNVGALQDTLARTSTLWVENQSETSWDQALDTYITNQNHFECQARKNAQMVTERMSAQRAWESLQHILNYSLIDCSTHLKIEIHDLAHEESSPCADASQVSVKHEKKHLRALTYSHAIVMTLSAISSIMLENCFPIFLAYLRLTFAVKVPWSPANAVTVFRSMASLAIFSWYQAKGRLNHIPPMVLILVSFCFVALDVVDGWLARRSKSGPTPIGALLDIEGDSIAMLLLSLAATFVVWEGAVIAGLLRYIYVIVSKAQDLHTRKINGGKGRWLAKYMAFFTVFALAISILWNSKFLCVLGVLNLITSFSVDFYQLWKYHMSVSDYRAQQAIL